MPDDAREIEWVVLPGAAERAAVLSPLRRYVVPYAIVGFLEIDATDVESARYVADHKPLSEFAERGNLEVFDPEPADAIQ